MEQYGSLFSPRPFKSNRIETTSILSDLHKKIIGRCVGLVGAAGGFFGLAFVIFLFGVAVGGTRREGSWVLRERKREKENDVPLCATVVPGSDLNMSTAATDSIV